MDLLESTLRTVNAQEYFENFQREGLTANNLKILSDEDLQLLGVSDEETRQKLLELFDGLIYAKEKRVAVVINHDYVGAVLSNIFNQMQLYNATLTCMALRQDCINCDIPLSIATNRLAQTLNELDTQTTNLHNQILTNKGLNRKETSKDCLFVKGLVIGLCISGLYIAKRLLF